MDLLITNATVVTMNAAREVLVGVEIWIQDGRILEVGRRLKKKQSAPRRVLDASGQVVLPGLIHGHLHACQTLFRNLADGLDLLAWLRQRIWPLESVHDERSMRASADLSFAELIKGGSTAALDMGVVRHTDAIFESARDCGFRLTGGKAMMDLGSDLPPALLETTADSFAESERLIKAWHGAADKRLRYAMAPRFVLSCTEDLLRGVAEKSRELSVRIHTHASENASECEAVRKRTGKDNVEYLHSLGLSGKDVVLAHCVWLRPEEHRILSETGTSVCHCPSANLKLASGLARVPELLNQGVNVCLGADGAACNNNLDIFTEMRLAALIHKPRAGAASMPPARVLEMATLGGAKALGLEEEIGSIEPGKRADLTVVDLSAVHTGPEGDLLGRLVHSARSSDVVHVIIDGKMVMRDRQLLTLDESAVVAAARDHAHRLAAKVS
ncbi:MAG TPA: 5'-deoxyadenosine deaminase [Myxococcaceae bacterium]|nr:5'-deoxyadenosine deaminase [Myxococcaceae bacterium]